LIILDEIGEIIVLMGIDQVENLSLIFHSITIFCYIHQNVSLHLENYLPIFLDLDEQKFLILSDYFSCLVSDGLIMQCDLKIALRFGTCFHMNCTQKIY
jgi:hypothetical protein